jgi:dephospho-CoA kinase
MPAIGITGGISTGKTSFCECLREIVPAAKFFDADQAAHELVDLEEVRRELRNEFGPEIFSNTGDLNRAALRAIVFESVARKSALEQILHPRIRRQWSALAETYLQSPDFFFADIPLLYETGGETLCDRVVVVASSPRIQLDRLLQRGPLEGRAPASPASLELRPPIDERIAKQMIESQMPLDEKIRRAHHVVWNNADQSLLGKQAASLVELWRQEKWTKN